MRRHLPTLALLLTPTLLCAQKPTPKPAPTAPMRLVLPQSPGAILIKLGPGWSPDQLHLLDDNTRIAAQFTNKQTNLVVSYILFPNKTAKPTAESCRAAVMVPILNNLADSATVSKLDDSIATQAGHNIALAAYTLYKASQTTIDQRNVFAFAGNATTCAQIHISKTLYKPADKPLFDAALKSFDPDLIYAATAPDFGLIGTLFFDYLEDWASAAIYYQRGLDTLPAADITAPTATTLGRVTTDQLAMSYGLSGDLVKARNVLTAAITRDPGYPMYYYNLACADAEENNPTSARTHLEQAFARRANTLPGEHLPDPTHDDSLLKLKSDTAFWTFVESLPRN